MEWNELFGADNKPSLADIEDFVGDGLWRDLNEFVRQAYGAEPETAYSMCSAQPGWNVKYRKSGKSLCTLYPMPGFFIALVVVGAKEEAQAELLIPTCCEYTRLLFAKTPFSAGGRWLMLHVTNAAILEDVNNLIKLRVTPGIRR